MIEGLSDKPFKDVAELLLAHGSVIGHFGIALCYAGREFFPANLFVNPLAVAEAIQFQMHSILVDIGSNLMIGMASGPSYGIEPYRYAVFCKDRLDGWLYIVWALWPGARRVQKLITGAPEFKPTAYHLEQIKPWFTASREYAEFLRDAGDLDATAAADVMSAIMPRYFQPIDRPFPRLQHLEEQMTSEL
jgi:hypothetical protein